VEECTYFWGVNTSWGINMAESKRPLNQEDNQAPQPTVIKGRNHGQLESKKTIEDTSSRIPSIFKPQRRSFTPRYENLFYGHCLYCTNFGHKVTYYRDYKINVQADRAYVVAHNIECYKCHNYGHIASDRRSMINTSMKENTDIRYKKA
jgi:hypothetical protein